MKTLITTFAIVLMVFAFSANPVMAKGEKSKKEFEEFKEGAKKGFEEFGELIDCGFEGKDHHECRAEGRISELKEPNQPDNERPVADSGEEGSTSAGSAGDQ